jgi:3-hydroxyacyl-CoA dehydrogenase
MPVSTFVVHGRVALLTLDHPPVNALSQPVRAALEDAVDRLASDDVLDAMVVACAGRTFIAGADIREFGKPSMEPFLTTLVDKLEASTKPVVAAIHGTALGGGLEVAMGCHYRISARSAKLGLPEVKLGLMPGARGTQHLPRLIGAEKALDMIANGTPIDAAEAVQIGLVDRVTEGGLVADAIAFAREVAQIPPPRTRDRPVAAIDPALFDRFAKANAKKFRGLDAPPAIIRAVKAATEFSFGEGAAFERETFLKLRAGPQNKALRHVFFAERQAAKVPGLDGVALRSVDAVGIVGAGTMGSGIAIAFLMGGLPVTLVEQDEAAIARGTATIRKIIEGNVVRGSFSRETGDSALKRLTTSLDFADLAQADLIVEAAFETMEVKQAVFERLDAVAKSGAILATNTSYLDVDAIAAATKRAQDVVGLHFFSPANVMKLLEIVRGRATAPDVLATTLDVAKRIKKIPVVAGNAYGFIGNRMLAVRRQEAERMIVEGASPYQVDHVAEAFGFPMGPFRMADLAGLDLGWSAATTTGSTIRERLNEAGRRGQKSGAGFYDYDEQRSARPSDEALAIIAGLAADHAIGQREFEDTEILDRLLWPMVNEGFRIVEEGIAMRASDVDVVWLNGYGWPRWTGGPLFHADTVGRQHVADAVRRVGHEPAFLLMMDSNSDQVPG